MKPAAPVTRYLPIVLHDNGSNSNSRIMALDGATPVNGARSEFLAEAFRELGELFAGERFVLFEELTYALEQCRGIRSGYGFRQVCSRDYGGRNRTLSC